MEIPIQDVKALATKLQADAVIVIAFRDEDFGTVVVHGTDKNPQIRSRSVEEPGILTYLKGPLTAVQTRVGGVLSRRPRGDGRRKQKPVDDGGRLRGASRSWTAQANVTLGDGAETSRGSRERPAFVPCPCFPG